MASFVGAFLLAYMLSASFTDQITANYSSAAHLVDYSYNLSFPSLIPGLRYNSTIYATWAVPDSALSGLDGRSVQVRVTAAAGENSSVFFLSSDGSQAKEASATLRCDVAQGACSNSSVLEAQIPVYIIAGQDESVSTNISLKSELIGDSSASAEASGGQDILQTFRGIFQQNESNSSQSPEANSSEFLNLSGAANDTTNFLDTLKPSGDSQDPIGFLRQNTLISAVALAIVVVITGAYLLNTKD